MVEQIKLLELELGIVLEVVHVPGTTIIAERTDGLSRGVWPSPLHQQLDRQVLITETLAPVPYAPIVGQWALNEIGLDPSICCHYRSWELPWRPEDMFDRITIWTPPPEIAAQLIYSLLLAYVERPLTTAMVILVPRILQRRWSRASRHVQEIGVYQRDLVPIVRHSPLTIPVVLLYIPFHVRLLSAPRMDPPPATTERHIHRQHVTHVCGLHDASG